MPEQQIGTFEALAMGVANIFKPLKEDLENGKFPQLFAQLGLPLPPSVNADTAFTNAIKSTVTAVSKMPGLIEKIIDGVGDEDYGKVANAGKDLFLAITDTIKGIETIATKLQGYEAQIKATFPSLPADFASNFPKRLIDYLIARNLEAAPIIPEVLNFINVLQRKNLPTPDNTPGIGTTYELSIEDLFKFISSPGGVLKTLYGWGNPSFNGEKLLETLRELISKSGFPAIIDTSVSPPVLDVLAFEVKPIITGDKGLEVAFSKKINIDNAVPFNNGGDWKLEGLAKGDIEASAKLFIKPDGTVKFTPPSAMASGEYGLKFTAQKADSTPFIIFGSPDSSRLSIGAIIAKLSAGFNFDSSSAPTGNFKIGGEVQKGKLVINPASGDGFISQILSGIKVESDFDFGFGFTTDEGVYFTGSAGLEIQLPSHIDLGPIKIDALTFSLGLKDNGVPVGLSANIKLDVGAFKAVVEGIGIQGKFTVPENKKGGNLGPVNFEIGFKPPKGVGLSLDAGPVKGGGYLFFDTDREEYGGALELVFSEWIALRAIGLITTKMPDGSKGFSLLIIITVEFGSGIQLGFGFTLLGVGGIIGLNRVVNVDPLKEGIRNGSVESVMFPQDIIANAPRIISDLRKFFPPKQDIFLIGPMAKIGWGTPTLASLSVGIILEFPEVNITILGVLKVILPDERADVLRLQVNFIGRIEPSNKLIWFYAELYDSRVLFITLEGGMGLLINWGDNANFVITVGGFHPRYSAPPLPFPEPPRLAVSILNTSFARIRIEAYFAVTSNSVQFGAHAELFFGVDAFCIEGHLGFDALFQFDPFFFSFGLSISLSVKVFGIGLFSVGFSGLLEGPTPWHIKGKGSISILFFDIDVPFEHTWGDEKNTELDPIKALPIIKKEIEALTNWLAKLPQNSNISVSLRKLGTADSDKLVLHPIGSLQISQRKIPLNFQLDKIGNQKTEDVKSIKLTASIAGAPNLVVNDIQEKFAIGQYKKLDDSARMSSPGFEPMDSGVEIAAGGAQLKTSQATKRVIRYETIIIDNNFKRYTIKFFKYFKLGFTVLYNFLFEHFLAGNAVSKSVNSQQFKTRMQPFSEKIEVKPNLYTVASNSNNKPFDQTSTSFTSMAMANQHMEKIISNDPALASKLHVLPNTEINTAA